MILYQLTILLGAFLVFQVQPVIAKIILPWFGGTATVWTTCLLFFQLVLLLGYLYAHALIRYVPSRRQALVHGGLLLLSAAALPIYPGSAGQAWHAGDPTWRILWVLAVSVGFPYLLLSATGPLVQAWFSRRFPDRTPYRLYALSNAGSMAALISYPLFFESAFTLHQQAWIWSGEYLAFLVVCGFVALRSNAAGTQESAFEEDEAERPTVKVYGLWMALPACASVLLMATTNHLSQNVAPVPFLWILLLSIYLVTFIFCFQENSRYQRKTYMRLLTLAIWAMALALTIDFQGGMPVQVLVVVLAMGLFVCCMACHGELALLKPHPRYLTHFYLTVAAGGALGGILVAVVAPRVFNGYYELPLALVACRWLAVLAVQHGHANVSYRSWLKPAPLATIALMVALGAYLVVEARQSAAGARVLVRNFYGILKVRDAGPLRILTHGSIKHGQEYLAAESRDRPISYYGSDTGIGMAIKLKQSAGTMRVGVVGLGTGTIAAYGRPGDTYRFYEINPLVVEIAQSQFFFLKDSKAAVDVVMGDGRLSLQAEPPQHFDLLAVDAFSGDSIPIHLLTREAMALYFRHLQPDGILAFHISNRYLDLRPVLAIEGDAAGRVVRVVETGADDSTGDFAATWVLIARPGFPLGEEIVSHSIRITPRSFDRLWTDDYSDPIKLLR